MDPFLKAGFDHPCKQTCSGWEQGRERGMLESEEKIDLLKKQLKDLASTTKAIIDISDRNHDYWDRAKEMIRAIEKAE